MITFFRNTDTGLNVIPDPMPGCWINVIDPTPDELAFLQDLHIVPDYLTYPLDLDERARTERENGDILIILRIPYFQGSSADVPFSTIPLGLILNDRFIITICKKDNDILQEFASGRMKQLSTAKRNRFVLRFFLSVASKYLTYLREINKTVDHIEDKLQLSLQNKEVMELLKYQKSLTYFTTALKSNELVMERIQRSKLFNVYPDDEDLLEDVITENQQAIEMTNIASNILSGMMDAFASIISNNLNVVMKFLAAITIIVSLPTTVASFYGMNVTLPLSAWPHTFWIILAVSVLLSIGVARFFVRRDWI